MVYIQSPDTGSTSPFHGFTLPTRPGIVSQYRINQAIPPVPSTSYDYWWPYDAGEDTPISTPSLIATSDDDPGVSTGAQDVVLSTDIPTPSLIQITALPPATTSPQAILPKLPYHRQVNILYLIPLFIALGIVLGAITVVTLFKCRKNRRRLLHTSSFLPGPPYEPPENDVEDRLLVHGYPSMEQVSLFAANTPSKYTIHGSQYIPGRTLAWQSLGATQPSYSQPISTHAIIPSSDGERFTVVTQDDPFLATSSMAMEQSPKPSIHVSPPEISSSPSLPASGDDSSAQNAQEAKSLKPFRRSMFDILKLRGPSRPVLGMRKEYTVLAAHEESADKISTNQVRRISNPKTTGVTAFAGERQPRRTRHSLDGGLYIGNMEDALGLVGSQGGEQDTVDVPMVSPTHSIHPKEFSPTDSVKTKKPRKVTPFSSEYKVLPKEAIYSEDESTCSGDGIEEEIPTDIYTKAPQRHLSRTPLEGLPTSGTYRRSSAPDTHASVLPLSPRSLMSPPLEKSLFFTSSLSLNASLTSRMNTLATTSSPPVRHVDRSPEFSLFPLPSKKTSATRKLRTSRPEPPLPYPLYPDPVHAQPTPGKRRVSADTRLRSTSPGSPKPKGHSTSLMHQESATGICSLGSLSPTSLAIALASSSSSDMLNKVNDIVARGYTKRRASMGEGRRAVEVNLPYST